MSKQVSAAELSHAAKKIQITEATQVAKERTHFHALLLANANYFGNLKSGASAAVVALQSNTTYEEIGCVGFHPQSKRLDAVVFVNQPYGYSGGLCANGSTEFVRFYISYDNGTTWIDQGHASFEVHDVPEGTEGSKRLEYAAGVPCDPKRTLCLFANTLRARAILSWNQIPPANQPDWVPVWGEVHNTNIQVDPLTKLDWSHIHDLFKLKLPQSLAQVVDLGQPIALKEPAALSLAELHTLYRDKAVEPHRYALAAVQQLMAQPAQFESSATAAGPSIFHKLDINVSELISKIVEAGDGSTYYEELECVGFNPNSSELVAVLRVKRPNGYSGGPCTQGSREYVTFWADLNNNGYFETCLGTSSVRVFDIAKFPDGGLEYTVVLPVNFSALKRPCSQGPRIVPIRAVLSWNSIPDCAFPNQTPVWGNREDTQILIPPGKPSVPGNFEPLLYNISSVAVCDIDQGTGFAPGDRPFGQLLYIIGEIPSALSLPGPDRIKYKLSVRPVGALNWQPIANDFGVAIEEQLGPGVLLQSPFTQSVDGAGFYTYREFGIGSNTWRRLAAPYMGLLGVWNTGAPMSGKWEIKVEALDTLTNTPYFAGTTTCSGGGTRTNVIVKLDEDAPIPALTITDFSTDGLTWHAAAACGDFAPGVKVRGTYSVSDAHFGSLAFTVEPAVPAAGATVSPPSRSYYAGVPTTGETGMWILDTAGMLPCGYVVRMDVSDRTIVSGGGGWHDFASVGFCLREPD